MRVPAIVLLLLAAAPATAAAGTFHVYGLGLNGAGCPNGWRAHSNAPGKFTQTDLCSHWRIRSTRDGKPIKHGQFAGSSMFTGEGARFTGFSIRSRGRTRNGVTWTMAMCKGAYTGCQNHFPRWGEMSDAEFALGTASPGGAPIYARHLYAGVSCSYSSCADSEEAGRAARVTHTDSHAVVEDYTKPGVPSVAGISTGWNSGRKQLSYSASDQGSGIAAVTLTVDGSLHRTNTHSCTRLPSGGYSQPLPCAISTGGEFVLNEPGQLADGRHTLAVTARDAGGEAAAQTREFWVDNNPPAPPLGLTVAGGDGWRARNDFGLAWQNPDQGAGSPVAAAYYKIGAAPTTPTDGTRVPGDGISRLGGLHVPRDGEWTVHVWLEDAAANADGGRPATAKLRFDGTPPSLAFANSRDAHSPAEVRVATRDPHSGLAGGRIDVRRRGAAEWQPLATRREGTQLVAAIPDERLERGEYELQATAWDGAGNSATTTRRADGAAMLVDVPLRGDTRLSAKLSRRARGARGARSGLRIGYGKRAWVRGILRAGAARLPRTRVTVSTRRAGRRWRPLTELVTDAHGRYSLRLRRGPSRDVRVRFPGSRTLRPAADVARLRVRGWAKLKLRPRALRRGQRIAFRGRVGHRRARIPAGGKLIQIQYLDGRRWRPAVKLGYTNRQGRFAIRYRFRRISRPTRIYFRILVPREAGWPYATGRSRVRTAFVRP